MAIKKGSKVSINYTMKVDGQVVGSTEERNPLTFEHGNGEMLAGVEKEVEGLNVGDKKSITVSPEDGFGNRIPEAIRKVPRDAFESTADLKVGSLVGLKGGGNEFQAVIVEMDEKDVVLDMNHPLAGKTLEMDIEVVNVD